MKDNWFDISDNKAKLDISLIHTYLSEESYWAKGRSMDAVLRSIENSYCFGAYLPDGRQIAFARMVTDQVVFAWIMDVFVVLEYRGMGVGKELVTAVLAHESLRQVNGIGLRTRDAHRLYRSFGFETLPESDTWMYRKQTVFS